MSIRSVLTSNLRVGFLLLLCYGGRCPAQVRQDERFEVPIAPNIRFEDLTVVSAQTDGLAVCSTVESEGKRFIEISRLDTVLHELWRGVVPISPDQVPRFSAVKNGILNILCSHAKLAKGDLSLVTLNLRTKAYNVYSIRNYIAFKPAEFLVTGETVMIGGYFNYRPFILHYSTVTRQSRILPGFFNDTGELMQLSNNTNGTVDVIVSAKNSDRRKSLWIRNYDTEGTLLKTTVLEPDRDKHLIFGRAVNLPDGEEVVAGVYGRSTEISRGIFVARIAGNGEYTLNYYNFADLQNFFRYMRTRKEHRIKERIERRKIRGKKNRFNYRFLVHQLIPWKDQFIMLGEAFYPQYKSTGSSTSFATGRSQLYFDGYQYTHAIVIGFSKSGKLLWDNSFEINDVKSFALDQFVKIQPESDHINLLYLIHNAIRSKIIRDDQVLEGKSMEDLKTAFDFDQKVSEWSSPNKLEYWYPGCLFAYGTQTIINTQQTGVALHRRVFFINKITNK